MTKVLAFDWAVSAGAHLPFTLFGAILLSFIDFLNGACLCRFTDIQEMVRYRLYSAYDSQSKTKVVLKLVANYRPAAHKLWGGKVAIELKEAIVDLPGGYSLLIMPFLSEADGWFTCNHLSRERQAQAKDVALQLLEKAHSLTEEGTGRCVVASLTLLLGLVAFVGLTA